MQNRAMWFLVVVSLFLLVPSAWAERCKVDKDCYRGEICHQRKCVKIVEEPETKKEEIKPGASPRSTSKETVPAKVEEKPDQTEADEKSEKGRHETNLGVALSGGFGYQYSGLGASLEWYIIPAVAVVAGGGYMPSTLVGGSGTGGGGGGARFCFFKGNHRLLWDAVHFGLAGASTVGGETDSMYGLTSAIGYQYLGPKGFLFNGSVGITWLAVAEQWAVDAIGTPVIPTINIGFGYKFF